MTYDTSAIRTVVNAFQTRLVARAGLAGVTILRYTPDSATLGPLREYIVLAVRIPSTQSPAALNRDIVYDDFSLHGEILTFQEGGGDAAADAAFARAEALYAEIEQEVRSAAGKGFGLPKVTGRLTGYEHVFGSDDRGRWHTLRFETTVRAHYTTH